MIFDFQKNENYTKCKDGTNSPPRMNYPKLIYNRRFDSVAYDRTIGNFFLSSWNHVILSVLPKLLKIFGPDKTKIPLLVNFIKITSFFNLITAIPVFNSSSPMPSWERKSSALHFSFSYSGESQ